MFLYTSFFIFFKLKNKNKIFLPQQTLNDMEKDNVSPNLNTFGLLAKICDSTLQCEELVKKMKMFGLQLDAAVAEILLTNAAESKNLDFIHSVMRHLQMHEVKADGKLCAILDDFGAALKADISTNVRNIRDILSSHKK